MFTTNKSQNIWISWRLIAIYANNNHCLPASRGALVWVFNSK